MTFAYTTRLMPTFGRGILFVRFRSQIATESGRCFFGSCFSVALSSSLADFVTEILFSRETPEHANALIMDFIVLTNYF